MADKTILEPINNWLEESFLDGAGHAEGWNAIFGDPVLSGAAGTVHITHLLMTGVVVVILVVLALLARRGFTGPKKEAMVPEGRIDTRNVIEAIFDFTLDTMAGMMGRENAKRYFPLIISLAMFILISNLLGLIPGFVPPTQNLNTTIAMAVSVFVCYNVIGIFKHGLSYFKEFVGPVWWLFFLMIPIEAVGHIFRPISLSVRLTGNMGGDHAVLGAFGTIANTFIGAPVLLPVPVMFLGLIVSVVQTMVFALLAAVYIAMAVEEPH